MLVTGATGRVGRLVVEALLRDGVHVRALTRRPESAVLPAGAHVVAGDLTVPASLDAALDGAGTVFLVWTAAVDTAREVVARLAAHASGQRRRVVYLSAPHQTNHPFFQQPNPLRGLHEEIERLLAAADVDTVVLRPGMFASNALHWWAPQLRRGDVVRWPYAQAETAPVDDRDIAAVAARVLLDDRRVSGDHVLTGPESLSQAAQLRAISDATGRALRFEELTPDEFRRETASTWPPAVAEMLLGAWRATLGHPAYVTSAVEGILGSPARTFHRWAVDNAAAFDGNASPAR
ncbi:MAG TPA: NmrA family NAD(P)-binding protein [Gemmatimonadaceae bacterium]|nr:NmrA family NAD(P)-binding protein [Gemmatimonadaceae bacterium]